MEEDSGLWEDVKDFLEASLTRPPQQATTKSPSSREPTSQGFVIKGVQMVLGKTYVVHYFGIKTHGLYGGKFVDEIEMRTGIGQKYVPIASITRVDALDPPGTGSR